MLDLDALYNGKQAASNSGLNLDALYAGKAQPEAQSQAIDIQAKLDAAQSILDSIRSQASEFNGGTKDSDLLNPALHNPYGGLAYASEKDAAPLAAHVAGNVANSVGIKNNLAQVHNAESTGGKFVQNTGLPMLAFAATDGLLPPELFTEGTLGNMANTIAETGLGSMASQAIGTGDVSAKQTEEDLALGMGVEGALNLLAKPAAKQVNDAYHALVNANQDNPALTNAVKRYLAGARTMEIGKHMQALQEQGLPHTVLDAYQAMYKEVPDMFKGEQYESLKEAVKKLKNNSSPSTVINYGKGLRDSWLNQAKALATDDAQVRKIKAIADANKIYNDGKYKTVVDISNDLLADTPLQKIGKTLEDYMGIDFDKLGSILTKKRAIKTIEPEVKAVKAKIRYDNKLIHKELQALEGKMGVSEVAKYGALSRQRTLNDKMLSYLDNGMKGRKVKIADIQQAIKDVQENQFERGLNRNGMSYGRSSYRNVTKQFQNVADKFEAMNITNLEQEEGVVGQVVKHYGLKAAAGAAGVFTGMGVPTVAISLAASAAGKLSRAAKAQNLRKAWDLLHMEVESGHITPEEAEDILKAGFRPAKNKTKGKVVSALREYAGNDKQGD